MRATSTIRLTLLGSAALAGAPAAAQTALDRADPTIAARALPRPSLEQPERAAPTEVDAASRAAAGTTLTPPVRAVRVSGAAGIPDTAFAAATAPVIGRALDRGALATLAGQIAGAVRARGYPFATASVAAQPMADGVLQVEAELGRIDAVRVIGARSEAADTLLVHALTGRGAVTQKMLERALLLVGDVPGVRVTETRYVRQDGFGILLVTIASDRASAYAQLDNRGSAEVGPVRSTLLASLRGLAGNGDELSLIVAQTPFEPSEFAFLRARYAAPVDSAGSVVAVAGSIARSHPGAALTPLDVVGRSGDLSVSYARALVRTRARSLWGSAELRAVTVTQTLRGVRLRRDRLATATASLNGQAEVAGGALRGELAGVVGLPLAGVSRAGDALLSRADGDARFVLATWQMDYTRRLGGPFSAVLAGAAQLASRPLLATAEIGLGGPGFARGYDYAERTGDQGAMASAELRADAGRVLPGVIDRAQGYAFVDGGHVGNLRDGFGGGTLASTGLGVRGGTGRLDGMVEVAFPLNADRFDTGNRRPRISLRLSRVF
ncbi:ShlB/FhaC/HecB family hemolysin secretion/activation protein [Sphingomonas sp. RHCKR7]|uniref:ShlB/FhaC/HecB family hemolysin secretion/activation protein n=1 Tax=Sphingomonas folli TaxID=2862497 RepID=UPI001CA4928F|nr:ShlB/FhaC/HecB family hemolysin secretion/activation protein [Sphingomonas folli]MBW6526386.1 ShlB/FhaC/HecB family hemolysin secretion/activation protein [Sphingomonas folli]